MSEQERALIESEIDPDPFKQFGKWFQEAEEVIPHLPNAMTLATAAPDGRPAARIVLLKDFDSSGFVFYTNYDSQKASELLKNANAALLFYWTQLGRQVRINGTVTKVSRGESDEYFHTRPIESQIGAWASNQSRVIENRQVLEDRFNRLSEEFEERVVPLPENWGGYRVRPDVFEFWQERPARLHDRIRYRLEGSAWLIERLAP